eukprot:Seg250.3 transcript_id=Seg250.3/GoldUCD/mRNA.D3Y31 product=Plasminogen protein_id=Seg250.3/GoldUCD/D3Y31
MEREAEFAQGLAAMIASRSGLDCSMNVQQELQWTEKNGRLLYHPTPKDIEQEEEENSLHTHDFKLADAVDENLVVGTNTKLPNSMPTTTQTEPKTEPRQPTTLPLTTKGKSFFPSTTAAKVNSTSTAKSVTPSTTTATANFSLTVNTTMAANITSNATAVVSNGTESISNNKTDPSKNLSSNTTGNNTMYNSTEMPQTATSTMFAVTKQSTSSTTTEVVTNAQSTSTFKPTAKATTKQITTTFMKTTTAKKLDTTSTALPPTTTTATTIISTTKANIECKVTKMGSEYRGKRNTTEFGFICQRWDSQTPQRHNNTPDANPHRGLEGNYCRNPDAEPEGPWCYITNPEYRWDYCIVPFC